MQSFIPLQYIKSFIEKKYSDASLEEIEYWANKSILHNFKEDCLKNFDFRKEWPFEKKIYKDSKIISGIEAANILRKAYSLEKNDINIKKRYLDLYYETHEIKHFINSNPMFPFLKMNSLYERKQWKSCLPREIKEIILSQFINHKLSVFSWKNFYPYRYEDEQVANRTGGFVLKTDKWVKEHYVQSLIESAEAIFLLKEIEDIEERFFSKELWML